MSQGHSTTLRNKQPKNKNNDGDDEWDLADQLQMNVDLAVIQWEQAWVEVRKLTSSWESWNQKSVETKKDMDYLASSEGQKAMLEKVGDNRQVRICFFKSVFVSCVSSHV